MRLTCPNCDAQYEVPDDVLPMSGRDVQCSNCGQTWFQHHPDGEPPQEDDAEPPVPPVEKPRTAEAEPPAPPPAQPTKHAEARKLDPAVADILREEAQAEQEARKRRQSQAEPLESQPDLGLSIADGDQEKARRGDEARRRMARMRGEPEPKPATGPTAATASSRRELLPDIDEINSTLRTDNERSAPERKKDDTRHSASQRRGGFGRGFILAVLLVVALICLYVFAPQIARAVPQVDPYLTSYVGAVDQARIWLDAQVQGILIWLDTMAEKSSG